MRQLSADLSELVGWAKEYGVYCAAEHARQAAAELEAVAEKRWGNDQKALSFEADLIVELISRNGAAAFGHWMHSIGQHLDVKPEDFSFSFDNVHVQESHHQRKDLARVIQAAMGRTPLKWAGQRGMSYSCGWGDYELYLSHRKAAALATEKLLHSCRFTFNVSLLHFQLALNGLLQTLGFIGRCLKRWYLCEQGAIKAPLII